MKDVKLLLKVINTSFANSVFLAFILISSLVSLETSADSKTELPFPSITYKQYKNKGLEMSYPADWVFLHDESGIIADRTIAFETEEVSRITIYIYENQKMDYLKLANKLEKQLKLKSSKDVQAYKRKGVTIGSYEGLKLKWKDLFISETNTEITILRLQTQPYKVLVQFYYFDDDIKNQTPNILTFMQGITFDLNKCKHE